MLNKYGIYCDPASNVSDMIVEQVVAGRSGRLFVPKDQVKIANVRSWPQWTQDMFYGFPWAGQRGELRFGDPEGLGDEGVMVQE